MKPPAFQFYVDDFLGGTMHFTDAELGLYVRLLCVQWSTGGLPDNDEELLSYGKGNPPLSRVKAKFKRGQDGLLRNDRMEQERAKQIEYRLRQSENGRRGGRPGKSKANPSLSQPEATPKPKESSPVSSLQSPCINTFAPPAAANKADGELFNEGADAKPVASAPTPKPRRPDIVFDAIAEVCGMAGKVNDMNAGQIAVAKKNILQCTPSVAPDEIRRRAGNYRHLWPSMTLTPTALAKHWTQCERGTVEPVRVAH